jgi:hypothetical protein
MKQIKVPESKIMIGFYDHFPKRFPLLFNNSKYIGEFQTKELLKSKKLKTNNRLIVSDSYDSSTIESSLKLEVYIIPKNKLSYILALYGALPINYNVSEGNLCNLKEVTINNDLNKCYIFSYNSKFVNIW